MTAYDEDVITVAIMVMVLGTGESMARMASEDVGSTTMHDALEHVTIQPCMHARNLFEVSSFAFLFFFSHPFPLNIISIWMD